MSITRRSTIGLLGAALGSSFVSPLFANAKKSYDLHPKKVADGIWMIEGAREYFSDKNGGAIVNCAFVETDAGLVIVDTGPSRRYGEALRTIATKVSGKGIAASINTHHHPDHYFGNQVFTDRPIYALSKTIELAKSEGDAFSDNMYRLLGDWMRGTEPTPPDTALQSSLLEIGNRKFRIVPLSGHTDSDLVLLDQQTGLMITGDITFLDRAPTTPHANVKIWKQSLEELKEIDAAAIVPGHGPIDYARTSIEQTMDYLNWLETVLVDSAHAGYDMVEIMERDIPQRFAKWGAMPEEFYRSVVHLFPDIERSTLPLTNSTQ